MADSTLTIGFTQATKKLTVTGTVAIREASIDVTVTNGASLVSDLVLKIQDKANNGATTPIGIVTTWSVSGAHAVGTLNLNTTEAIAAFETCGNVGMKTFNVLLYTSTSSALMCNGIMAVMNFPSSTTSSPTTLDQQTAVDALADRVTELEAGALTAVYNDDFDDLDFTDLSTNEKRNNALRALLDRLQGNV